jgi:hypothetical protein
VALVGAYWGQPAQESAGGVWSRCHTELACDVVACIPHVPFLRATLITIVDHRIATFGMLVVLPPQEATNPALLGEVFTNVFGRTLGGFLDKLTDGMLVNSFLYATAALHLMFARLLVVTGVGLRVPRSFRRLNQHGVPVRAMAFPVAFTVVSMGILFYLVP